MPSAGDLAFVAMAVNPFGGVLIAIPFALFELKYSPWLALAVGMPLSYAQVIFVDAAWSRLLGWRLFRAQLAKKRSPRVERLMASKGAFWPTFLLAPIIGPWLVMALMRYARVPQRKVGVPIFLGLAWWTAAITAACVWIPRWFGH
ncbi:MAG: hypothetical protein HY077_16105 [Elusimicrobia bacterium]|nr:hypothetical protein [Elusimicrobiota bacterium]